MVKAVAFYAARRQDDVRLFEIGHVFRRPTRPASSGPRPDGGDGDRRARDARRGLRRSRRRATTASAAWTALAEALGVDGIDLVQAAHGGAGTTAVGAGLHPARSARLVIRGIDTKAGDDRITIGVVGEVDPAVLDGFGVDAGRRRVGWIEVDLDLLLHGAPRRQEVVTDVSRFPSSDVDLAFVVDEAAAAAEVARTLEEAGGELLEEVALFDVYRGPGVPAGSRSLAYRLRFCALDHTLTDEEVGGLRRRCIEAVERKYQATLRA